MATKKVTAAVIKAKYIDHVVGAGDHPSDIYAFCSDIKISDVDFLKSYSDIQEVHVDVWKDFMTDTLSALADDDQFATFSGREQLLAFYYTHVEVLKQHRDFILIDRSRMKVPIPLPQFMVTYKDTFVGFAKSLIAYAMETGEVADRKFLNSQYARGVWAQLYWVVQFWIKDSSNEFELTDAAIEKAVNLSLELVKPGPLDSMIDFAKFIYQNR